MLRIEHVLDPFHEFKIRSRGGPQIQLGLVSFRSEFHYSFPRGVDRFGRLGVIEVDVADAGSRPRHDRRVDAFENLSELRKRAGDPHYGAVFVGGEVPRSEFLKGGERPVVGDPQAADLTQFLLIAVDYEGVAARLNRQSVSRPTDNLRGGWIQQVDRSR